MNAVCRRLARTARSGAPEPPILLALLRIAVAAVVLLSPEPAMALAASERAAVLRIAPAGLAWLGTVVPLTPHAVRVATALLRASACLVVAGVLTRASLALLLACFVYLFGAAQLTGTVVHDMHLAWMMALLIASPSGDALSCDAWARGRGLLGGPCSPASSMAVLFARVLLGLVYFFPGVRKLAVGGIAWVASDNLRNQMRFKWFEAGGVAAWPRLDLAPRWCVVAATAVIAFECSFVVLAVTRRGRPVALAGGLLFHAMIAHFLYVPFSSLWALYVVLLDGRRLRALLGGGDRTQPRPREPGEAFSGPRGPIAAEASGTAPTSPVPWAPLAVGVTLVIAVAVQGVRGATQAWPVACYPTFETLAPDAITDLAIELRPGDREDPDGTLRDAPDRPPTAWGTTWRLLGLYGGGIDGARLEAYASELAARSGRSAALARAARVSFVAETYSIDPARYGGPPLTRVVVYVADRAEGK